MMLRALPPVLAATPDESGIWIADDAGHNGARLVLIAQARGWAWNSCADAIRLAEREMRCEALTVDESDALDFQYAEEVEYWLNENVAPEGYRLGWHAGEFRLETFGWWNDKGGPDQLWLP